MKIARQTFYYALFACLLWPGAGQAQQVFFQSAQNFEKSQLGNFHSSAAIAGDLIVFSANDYNLYAYHKHSGTLKWTCEASYKSDIAPFSAGEKLYAGIYQDKNSYTGEIDAATGKITRVLPFGPLASVPFIKNGILYGTALYDAGCLVAYDLVKDTVQWSRFLAHGFSRQPYFFDNLLVANAEADNWVAIQYGGALADTSCKTKADLFVKDIPCVNHYLALTHDRKEIKGKIAQKIFGDEDLYSDPEIKTTGRHTLILHKGVLTIMGNKLKIERTLQLSTLPGAEESEDYEDRDAIVKADEKNVYLLYNDRLIIYDHQKKKHIRTCDLSAWQPHQVLVDDDRLWVISRKDGLLYGLTL